jgi:5'-nucleotidase
MKLNLAIAALFVAAPAADVFAQSIRGRASTVINTPAVQQEIRVDGMGDPSVVTFWLTVLHMNDTESKVLPIASNGFAGAAQSKAVIDRLRVESQTFPADPNNPTRGVILVTSGDNILPGVGLNASLSQGPNAPILDARFFELADFDSICLGNHDFDIGPAVTGRFIGSFTNNPIPFLASNLDFSGEPALQPFTTIGRLAGSVIVNVAGISVGIIGADTTDLSFISQPGGVIVNPVLPAVQEQITALRSANVKHIILTSHLQGLTSEFNLVPLLDDLDAVVGGGGSELLANPSDLLVPGDVRHTVNIGGTGYPRFNNDINGTPVPIVTTTGDYKYVGRLILGFNALGDVVQVHPASGPVRVAPSSQPDGVIPDPFVKAQVEDPVAAYQSVLANTFIANTAVGLDGRNNATGIRALETNLGNMTADSLLYHATVNAAAFNAPLPDVAIQNGGGIRNNSVIGPGRISVLDTFNILPFTNYVTTVINVSPDRFKELLENAVANVGLSGSGRFAQISGFTLVWDAARQRQITNTSQPTPYTFVNTVTTPGQRVREVVLSDGSVLIRNGQVVPGARSINIATIDFLANGGDQYTMLGLPRVILGGATYQVALENYLRNWLQGNVDGFNYPVGGEGRIIRLN